MQLFADSAMVGDCWYRRPDVTDLQPSIGDLLTELMLRESVDFSRLVTSFVIAEQQSLDTPDESLESIESPRHRWKEPIAKSTTSFLAAGRRTIRGRAIVHDGQCTSAKCRRPDPLEMQPFTGGLSPKSRESIRRVEDKSHQLASPIIGLTHFKHLDPKPRRD